MGRRVFEPLRSVARETLQFPDTLSPGLEVIEDSGDGVWLRRMTLARNERWARR